jgi:hypothetical protein
MSSLGVEVRQTLLDIPPPFNNGVFALRKFKKGEIVVVYARPGDGSIELPKDQYERRRKKNQVYGVDVQRNMVVDAAKSSNLGKFVNMLKHRNNVRLVTNWWGPGQRQITFKAIRTIQIGEEIYASYGRRYQGMDARPLPRPPMRRGPKPKPRPDGKEEAASSSDEKESGSDDEIFERTLSADEELGDEERSTPSQTRRNWRRGFCCLTTGQQHVIMMQWIDNTPNATDEAWDKFIDNISKMTRQKQLRIYERYFKSAVAYWTDVLNTQRERWDYLVASPESFISGDLRWERRNTEMFLQANENDRNEFIDQLRDEFYRIQGRANEQSPVEPPPPQSRVDPLPNVTNLGRRRVSGPTPIRVMLATENLDPSGGNVESDPQIHLSEAQMRVIERAAQYQRLLGGRVASWEAIVVRMRSMSRDAQLRKYDRSLHLLRESMIDVLEFMFTNFNIARQVPGNVTYGRPRWDFGMTERFIQLNDDDRAAIQDELRGIMEGINANRRVSQVREEDGEVDNPIEVDAGDPDPPSDSSLTSDSSDSQDPDSSSESSDSDHASDFSDLAGDVVPVGPPHRLPRNHRHYVPQNVNRGILMNMVRRYSRVPNVERLIQELQRRWPNMTRDEKANAYKAATRLKRAGMRKRRRLANRARQRQRNARPQPGPGPPAGGPRQRPPAGGPVPAPPAGGPIPGPRLPKSWTNAIRVWRVRTGVADNSPWCTPIKGSPEYLVVRAIYDSM